MLLRSLSILAFIGMLSMPALADETNVHVSGTSSVKVAPDQAEISFDVVEQGRSADALKPSVDEKVAKVIKAAEELGIESRDIQATGVSVHPNYTYHRETGEQRLVGVTVQRSIRITVRDLAHYPKLIDAALAAGVNQAGQVSLTLADPSAAEERAIREAIDDALTKARVVADQLGLKVSKVSEVRAHINRNGPRPLVSFAAAKMESADSSFREGEISIDASVSMTVELGKR